jgi:anaerobic selenocysteine-containing dehydrogenase
MFASPAVEHSPSLRFLAPHQRAELSPADAERLGIGHGDEVELRSGDRSLHTTAALREAVRPGSVFLTQGLGADGAEALTNGSPGTVELRSLSHAGDRAAAETDATTDMAGGGGSDAPGAASEVVPEPSEAADEAPPGKADRS